MTVEEQHAAFPKLMGAPAYARPPAPVDPVDRPFDPDLLPVESQRTEEDRELVSRLLASSAMTGEGVGGPVVRRLDARTFTLRGLADRLRPRR